MKQTEEVSVVIVIPVYNPTLTDHERISFIQCVHVLGRYPIVLIAPHSLNISEYQKLYAPLCEYRFNDSYFSDIQGYNKLMLSEEFYEAFTSYEYMLIHQLDAFVFSDKLEAWCRRGTKGGVS